MRATEKDLTVWNPPREYGEPWTAGISEYTPEEIAADEPIINVSVSCEDDMVLYAPESTEGVHMRPSKLRRMLRCVNVLAGVPDYILEEAAATSSLEPIANWHKYVESNRPPYRVTMGPWSWGNPLTFTFEHEGSKQEVPLRHVDCEVIVPHGDHSIPCPSPGTLQLEPTAHKRAIRVIVQRPRSDGGVGYEYELEGSGG